MIYHPTLVILPLVIALTVFYRKNKVFKFIAVSIPLLASVSLYNLEPYNTINICNINFIYEGTAYNKLIASAFLMVMFSANIYALGKGKKDELVLGNGYGGMALLCLLAGDFISMLIALELMLIFSTAIIFIGKKRESFRAAKKYFITHIISSNMIMLGVAHIIINGDSIAIRSVTELINNPQYSNSILTIMLAGMVINIAAFPFSGWMVNYYKHATPSGFCYLLLFTTKVSVMLLIKTFAGYQPLQYVAILMIIYASIKVMFENNIFAMLCYLSINAMGLMLLGISVGSEGAILATVTYLFIHILYKSMLNISCAAIVDYTGISFCTDLKKLRSTTILVALGVGVAMMVNMPLTSSFYIKSEITHIFFDSPIYFITIFLTVTTVFALPWKRYFFARETVPIKLNIYTKASLITMSGALIFVALAAQELPVLLEVHSFKNIKLLSLDTVKQLSIIGLAALTGLLFQVKRRDTNPINLFEHISNLFFFLLNSWIKSSSRKNNSEPWMIETLEDQAISKAAALHNQQTAIFIVFTAFVIALGVMLANI